ncbi:MAG: hypothetical protein K2G40_04090, partial [Muribaculaceae bacterium]|nr:hypothetical protein [Muribaculaceae bacterium]
IENSPVVDTVDKIVMSPEFTPVSKFPGLLHKLMKYAAMIVMFISMAIIFSTPVSINSSDEIIKANLCPFEFSDNCKEYIPEFLIALPAQADDAISVGDGASDFASELKNPSVASVIDNPETSEIKAYEPREGEYILVIGSLVTAEQAQRFIKDTVNDAMGVIEINGRYRVYGAVSTSTSDLMKSELLSKYPDAWPCRVSGN